MDLYSAVSRTIRANGLIEKDDCVLAAVSGGADSVCLLHVLDRLRRTEHFSLCCAHVHHGIRKEADEDARFVEQMAGEMGIPFFLRRIDVPALHGKTPGKTLEEIARDARYEALFEAASAAGATKIAVAHNAGDNAETFLFRLFRGTGVRGLSGIPLQRGRIIRPLLFQMREDIEAYLEGQGLSFVTDATNADMTITRNAIRLHILKEAKTQVNPHAAEHTAQAAQDLSAMRAYLERAAEEALARCIAEPAEDAALTISIPALKKEDPFLQREALYRALVRLEVPLSDIKRVHIEDMLALCTSDNGRASLSFPGGMEIRRTHALLNLILPPINGKISRSPLSEENR